jgi:mono/diheme cytochrome c family protein
MKIRTRRATSSSILFLLVFPALVFATLLMNSRTAYALPEYATRTGEPCAACHVSAGGGGPRTLRGLLWSARGKPDKVPVMPGMLIAPRAVDGIELYQIACGGCHGNKGEGLFAMGLVNTKVNQDAVRSFILHGIPRLGMPSFEGQFTDAQLDTLVAYVGGMASGEIPPPPDFYRLPAPVFSCAPASTDPACQAAAFDEGGN